MQHDSSTVLLHKPGREGSSKSKSCSIWLISGLSMLTHVPKPPNSWLLSETTINGSAQCHVLTEFCHFWKNFVWRGLVTFCEKRGLNWKWLVDQLWTKENFHATSTHNCKFKLLFKWRQRADLFIVVPYLIATWAQAIWWRISGWTTKAFWFWGTTTEPVLVKN